MLGESQGKNRFAKIKKITSNIKYCQMPNNNCGKPVGKVSKNITKSGSIQLMATYIIDNRLDDKDLQKNAILAKKKKNIEFDLGELCVKVWLFI